MRYDHALTVKDFNNPYLINTNKDEIISIKGNLLTAEYIWSLNEKERENLIEDIVEYYYNRGFPYQECTREDLNKDFIKLKKVKEESILTDEGYLKNSNPSGLLISRYYNKDLFYKVRGDTTPSVEDIFYNKECLVKVLQNRMGWYTSNEDGTERPYIFGITDKMLIQGIHSSAMGFNVSQFKPAIGKYLYKKYAKEKVFDYSCGWGARALAAISLGLEYYGTDPLTAENTNKIIQDFGGKGKAYQSGSEVLEIYKNIPQVDTILSSPPYFVLEKYSEDNTQSVVKYNEYEVWLKYYWRDTVKNCMNILQEKGYFILIMKDVYKKYNLLDDMTKICLDNNLTFVEDLKFTTSRNHLSGKAKSKVNTKQSEIIRVFQK